MTTQVQKIKRLVRKYPNQTAWFYAKRLRSNRSHYKCITVLTELMRMLKRGTAKRKVKCYRNSVWLNRKFAVWKWRLS